LGLEITHVAVLVAIAGGLAQADAVDDRCVVQLIGDDRIVLAEEHFEYATIRVETRGEEDRRVGAEQLGNPRLEQVMLRLGATDESHARHAKTVLIE